MSAMLAATANEDDGDGEGDGASNADIDDACAGGGILFDFGGSFGDAVPLCGFVYIGQSSAPPSH